MDGFVTNDGSQTNRIKRLTLFGVVSIVDFVIEKETGSIQTNHPALFGLVKARENRSSQEKEEKKTLCLSLFQITEVLWWFLILFPSDYCFCFVKKLRKMFSSKTKTHAHFKIVFVLLEKRRERKEHLNAVIILRFTKHFRVQQPHNVGWIECVASSHMSDKVNKRIFLHQMSIN